MGEEIKLACKCAPSQDILDNINKANIDAVELYLSYDLMKDFKNIISLCKDYPFQYVLHAPSDNFSFDNLFLLAKELNSSIIVFHNILWEDEWEELVSIFSGSDIRLCIENTSSVHEPVKFIRRYNLYRCLDVEHFQMECSGFFEEEFVSLVKSAVHIHLTGYIYNSSLWHTHIHYSKEHNMRILNIIYSAGYKGLIVSEAKRSLQNLDEFIRLKEFFVEWKSRLIQTRR